MAAAAGEMTRKRWRLPGPRTIVMTVTVLLLAVLATLGTLYWQSASAAADRAAANEQALVTARQVAGSLTSVSSDTVERDVARLASLATGSFKDEFAQQNAAFRQVVTESQVHADGTVTEAALSSSDEQHAVALTAVRATVRNAAAPEGQPRQYRLRITLERSGEQWLVSNLEFVS